MFSGFLQIIKYNKYHFNRLIDECKGNKIINKMIIKCYFHTIIKAVKKRTIKGLIFIALFHSIITFFISSHYQQINLNMTKPIF
ncbi:hypothetical protein HMPREF0841_0310 [Streptococcus pyogenes ATCC 10782]|nr:hypothetical protein HMPREF0841_0310 [Streptococcus pyogenes ATCC 10782]